MRFAVHSMQNDSRKVLKACAGYSISLGAMAFTSRIIKKSSSLELALFAICLTFGTALSILLLPGAPHEDFKKEATHLLGVSLHSEKGEREESLEQIDELLQARFQLYLPDGTYEVFEVKELEPAVDEEHLTNLLLDATDPYSLLQQRWQEQIEDASSQSHQAEEVMRTSLSLNLPVPVKIDTEATSRLLIRLKDLLDQPPENARINLTNKEVIPHIQGRYLDIDATRLGIIHALKQGKLRSDAQFRFKNPQRRSEELKGLNFDHILGSFSTKYSQARKAKDRTYNLRIAAQRLDGTVILPGQVFDFNRIVGPRDEAHGYRVATVIANGELVDGIGGGTCQISGTLHGAAFFGGLEIIERYPHTRPSSYIKMGMDATVVYPTINFRMSNPFKIPVVLHMTVEAGKVEAQILGAQIDQVITLIRKIDQAIEYEEQERPDAQLAQGKRILAQRGIPGFRLHRYRIRRTGAHTTREKWHDFYPPTPQIIRVGTGSLQSPTRRSSGTPEYLADELLVITQKRPRAGQPAELVENREAGRFGQPGWTQEAGMAFWQ